MLSPFLEECLKKAYDYKIENTLMTSDDKLLGKLSIWLSIHGINSEHDKITLVEKSFLNLENALKSKQKGYQLSVWCVLTSKLKEKINEYVEWCIKNKIEQFILQIYHK